MKRNYFTQYIGIFVLAVLIIAVYKTFDSIGLIFQYAGSIIKLFMPIITAFIIAFTLFPFCSWFERLFSKAKLSFVKKHRRGISVLCIYILFLAVVSLFLSLMLPALISSISEFAAQLPEIFKSIKGYFYDSEPFGIDVKEIIQSISVSDILSNFELNDVHTYIDRVAGLSSAMFKLFLSLIISVYILMDRGGLVASAGKVGELIFPEKSRAILMKYINRTFNIMYKYIYCQFSDARIVFLLSFAVVMIMSVKYAPVLALTLGLFNLIPYFGAITASILASVLTVFTASFSKGIWVAVALIVLQQVDANVIQPRLVRGVLQVKPFWVLCGISVGGGLFGIWGILLAVPFMAFVKTLFDDYYDYIDTKKNISSKQRNNVTQN